MMEEIWDTRAEAIDQYGFDVVYKVYRTDNAFVLANYFTGNAFYQWYRKKSLSERMSGWINF